jgi:dolichol-phosphate mannosyltransferase
MVLSAKLMPLLSLVIPIYNEEDCIPILWAELQKITANFSGYSIEYVFVDDGSLDQSFFLLEKISQQCAAVKVLRFSRNFGHQIAITAGLDYAAGDAVIVMDADLQDPPEVLTQMLAKYEEGYDVVYAVRQRRSGETLFKKITAKCFYRLLNAMSAIPIPLDTGDFRLVTRRVADALKTLGEKDRFVRGLVSWVGFKQTPIYFERHARLAGETKYPLKKMISFALNGILSFSTLPLKWASWLGFFFAFFSGLYILVVIALRLMGYTFPGYASLMVGMLLLGGIQLMTIGILGEYIGRLYMESKKRPLYIVQDAVNVAPRG